MNKDSLIRILELMRQNNFNQQADELEALAKQFYDATKNEKKKC